MFKRFIQRLVKKHGMKGLLMLVGDHAVKATKSTKDDEIWEEVKMLLEGMDD
tara:strand:+ start:428 stop:583 length:156 start_codon:yes stop_codon:yes gene_type:complete